MLLPAISALSFSFSLSLSSILLLFSALQRETSVMLRFTAMRPMLFTPTAPSLSLFRATQPNFIAHWYCGHKFRHRFMRDKRFHPSQQASHDARNRFSKRRHFKTNRWNYTQAYKDMP